MVRWLLLINLPIREEHEWVFTLKLYFIEKGRIWCIEFVIFLEATDIGQHMVKRIDQKL